MADPVRVYGLRELQRAFAAAEGNLDKDLRASLQETAEPVRADAETLAASEVENISPGDPWAEMRVGVTKTAVYVAPRRRTSRDERRKRPNLAGLLDERALEPALERNTEQIIDRVDGVLERLETTWERA